MQMQQQLETQQAQHAAQISDMDSRADELQSMWKQATDLDQQHLAQLRAREADLDELNQVRQLQPNLKWFGFSQLGSAEIRTTAPQLTSQNAQMQTVLLYFLTWSLRVEA